MKPWYSMEVCQLNDFDGTDDIHLRFIFTNKNNWIETSHSFWTLLFYY